MEEQDMPRRDAIRKIPLYFIGLAALVANAQPAYSGQKSRLGTGTSEMLMPTETPKDSMDIRKTEKIDYEGRKIKVNWCGENHADVRLEREHLLEAIAKVTNIPKDRLPSKDYDYRVIDSLVEDLLKRFDKMYDKIPLDKIPTNGESYKEGGIAYYRSIDDYSKWERIVKNMEFEYGDTTLKVVYSAINGDHRFPTEEITPLVVISWYVNDGNETRILQADFSGDHLTRTGTTEWLIGGEVHYYDNERRIFQPFTDRMTGYKGSSLSREELDRIIVDPHKKAEHLGMWYPDGRPVIIRNNWPTELKEVPEKVLLNEKEVALFLENYNDGLRRFVAGKALDKAIDTLMKYNK